MLVGLLHTVVVDGRNLRLLTLGTLLSEHMGYTVYGTSFLMRHAMCLAGTAISLVAIFLGTVMFGGGLEVPAVEHSDRICWVGEVLGYARLRSGSEVVMLYMFP